MISLKIRSKTRKGTRKTTKNTSTVVVGTTPPTPTDTIDAAVTHRVKSVTGSEGGPEAAIHVTNITIVSAPIEEVSQETVSTERYLRSVIIKMHANKRI